MAVILAIAGTRLGMRFPAVPDDGREAVRSWLVNDYEGRGPKALAQMVSDYRAGLPVQTPDPPAVVPQVDFVSLGAHGSRELMIVRAQVFVNGGLPPDDRPVRYLFLTRKFDGGGWMITSETTAFRYYEALVD